LAICARRCDVRGLTPDHTQQSATARWPVAFRALNRRLYGLDGPKAEPHEKKVLPFTATRHHQVWAVDVRYLEDGKIHHLGGGNVYVITVLDCYSRAVLASAISRTQDLTAYLMVLFAAIRQHGSPERLVSDSGSIFYGEAGLARRSAAVWLYRETRQSSSRISPSRSTLSRTSPTTPTCSA